jgi:hypothetical protein
MEHFVELVQSVQKKWSCRSLDPRVKEAHLDKMAILYAMERITEELQREGKLPVHRLLLGLHLSYTFLSYQNQVKDKQWRSRARAICHESDRIAELCNADRWLILRQFVLLMEDYI